jgi:metal-sulfur cluster biosynthetic enzyme
MSASRQPANTVLSERIMAELNDIVDPCSVAAGCPAGLVEMGLIRSLELRDTATGCDARVTMALTHPFCMMAPVFVNEARIRVADLDGVTGCDVELDATYIWTDDDMSPEYAERRRQSLIERGILAPLAASAGNVELIAISKPQLKEPTRD